MSTDTVPAGSHRCTHQPACPSADRQDHEAARVVSGHPEQGWSLLCNGVVLFDDTGELLPDGRSVPAHRPAARHRSTASLVAIG
jgi:hypothetical protein